MNKVVLMGRLVRDPEIRYSQGQNSMAVSKYTLAVPRKFRKEGDQKADFISCVTFGKPAEFAGKYLRQGIKVAITGRIQTGSYTNKDGQKVYTTDVVVDECEFAESKSASQIQKPENINQDPEIGHPGNAPSEGFVSIPDYDAGDIPFR